MSKLREQMIQDMTLRGLSPNTQQRALDEIRALVTPLGASFDFPYRSELEAWRRRGV